ncbi:hypothetical protein PR048_014135 [Dryococelus australis]|uniref:Uncharacterized protein n=1 Tax=Dryococelus australis TaxID=614101 RepID=A0ABQ9HDD5_9NEOP|nr:hypothetical protein PR048_014135 [Dryococelus australis]
MENRNQDGRTGNRTRVFTNVSPGVHHFTASLNPPHNKNLPTNGIVRHDLTCENPVVRPGIEPVSPWWEARALIAQPPRPPLLLESHVGCGSWPAESGTAVTSPRFHVLAPAVRDVTQYSPGPREGASVGVLRRPRASSRLRDARNLLASQFSEYPTRDAEYKDTGGKIIAITCAWQTTPICLCFLLCNFDCSPPTKANRVQSPVGSLRIFASGNRAGRCRWWGIFSGISRFPPLFHFGASPYSPHFTLIDSQDLAIKSHLNLSALHYLTGNAASCRSFSELTGVINVTLVFCLRRETMRVIEVNMERRRNEGSAETGDKPAYQRHRPARFTLAIIR